MPGAPVLHGYMASNVSAAGEGGAARVAAAASPLTDARFPSNVSFFVWLLVIGVIVPAVLLGGLSAGRFKFVFKGR